ARFKCDWSSDVCSSDLGPDACVDQQDVFTAPHHHAVEAELHSMLGVDVLLADDGFPHHPWDKPHYGACVELDVPVADHSDFEIAHGVTDWCVHVAEHTG